ncbi:hypothetical protein ACWF95_38755 [Streptomyces vinaceus]
MADDLLQDLWLHQAAGVTVNALTVHPHRITVHAATISGSAGCPSCATVPGRAHSSYVRRLDDASMGGRPVVTGYGSGASAAANRPAPGPRSL